jgi:hypothetical protein
MQKNHDLRKNANAKGKKTKMERKGTVGNWK